MSKNILVIGSEGQIGTELCTALETTSDNNVYRADIRLTDQASKRQYHLDATDKLAISNLIENLQIEEVYLMAALLSASGEKNPGLAWHLNMNSLLHLLDLAKEGRYKKLFWPSSIAVFGPDSPKIDTPQHTIINPTTVYGISKRSGEFWCEYYHKKYGVDVRSLRYPGLISHQAEPGGGTTDYAVDIIKQALLKGTYSCYLSEDTKLPMLYMSDAIRATLDLMKAPEESIQIRSSYNLNGFTASPKLMAESIRRHLPNFSLSSSPDFRQEIADSWPKSIDDTCAREHWGYKALFDLDQTVDHMLLAIRTD